VNRELRKKYNLSRSEYEAMMLRGCGICAEWPATDVDHDHLTGQVRGPLCGRCNRGIGTFGDDPALLLSAASYLEGR
jgi:hypothetical protein